MVWHWIANMAMSRVYSLDTSTRVDDRNVIWGFWKGYGLKLKSKIRSKLLITKPDYRWSREKCKFFLVSMEFKTKKKCDEIMRNCNSFLLHEVIFSLLV